MASSSKTDATMNAATSVEQGGMVRSDESDNRQLSRWGGVAALGGVASLIGSVIVVVSMGLPNADDPETLTDFADIESGRLAEHFFYLGALVLFALHVFVLHRLLKGAHPAAALFGTVLQTFGLVILAASAMLHVSTAPLAALYSAPDTPPRRSPVDRVRMARRGERVRHDARHGRAADSDRHRPSGCGDAEQSPLRPLALLGCHRTGVCGNHRCGYRGRRYRQRPVGRQRAGHGPVSPDRWLAHAESWNDNADRPAP